MLPLVKPPARTILAGSLNQNVGPHNIENLGPKKGAIFWPKMWGQNGVHRLGGRRLVPGFWAGKRPPKRSQKKTKEKGIVLSGPHFRNTCVIVSEARVMRAPPASKL